jgi:hypothetical protein
MIASHGTVGRPAMIGHLELILTALVSGLIGSLIPIVIDWFTRPRLSVDYANDDGHFVDFDQIRRDGVDISAVYVRVRIENVGRRVAKGCRVFLTRLEEVLPSETKSTNLHDALVLGWPGGKDYSPRDIPRDVEFYADVVCVAKRTPNWMFRVQQMYAKNLDLPKYRGTYRFHILATADEADPAQCKVDVTYDGDWHNFRAVPVP